MDDTDAFLRWLNPWKNARNAAMPMNPIGWYGTEDMHAAFNAGRAAEQQRGLDEILERTRRLEDLLRSPDDRPGTQQSPPSAGPVPTQE